MKSPNVLLFLCFLVLICTHQVAQQVFHIKTPLIDSYLDPFLGIALLLFMFKLERFYLWKRKIAELSILEISLVVFIVACISEFVFPILSNDFTKDYFDLLAFAMGGMFFYFTMNKTHKAK